MPWSLASPMRSTGGDACNFGPFFFFGFGFHVIVGGGGVRSNPCDLGCINGVDSSLHFFFFEVVLCDGGLYLWVVVVAGCACVWWWVCYSSVLVFAYGGGFLFCIFFIDRFFNIFIYCFNV